MIKLSFENCCPSFQAPSPPHPFFSRLFFHQYGCPPNAQRRHRKSWYMTVAFSRLPLHPVLVIALLEFYARHKPKVTQLYHCHGVE